MTNEDLITLIRPHVGQNRIVLVCSPGEIHSVGSTADLPLREIGRLLGSLQSGLNGQMRTIKDALRRSNLSHLLLELDKGFEEARQARATESGNLRIEE